MYAMCHYHSKEVSGCFKIKYFLCSNWGTENDPEQSYKIGNADGIGYGHIGKRKILFNKLAKCLAHRLFKFKRISFDFQISRYPCP